MLARRSLRRSALGDPAAAARTSPAASSPAASKPDAKPRWPSIAGLPPTRASSCPSPRPQLDIVFWAPRAATPAESSALAQAIFDEARRRDLYLALATLPARFFPPGTWPRSARSDESVTCLRSVMMKPEHLAWLDEIWSRLAAAATTVVLSSLSIPDNGSLTRTERITRHAWSVHSSLW